MATAADTTPDRAQVIDQVVKAYDIRGLVGSQLDETFVRDVGSAFARVLLDEQANGTGSGLGHGGAVVVAHDMRESSPGWRRRSPRASRRSGSTSSTSAWPART